MKQGLYYLDLYETHAANVCMTGTAKVSAKTWHSRQGHAPLPKLQSIYDLSIRSSNMMEICATCPMARFTKLPFTASESHENVAFALVYIDIWGPYRVPARAKYMYFLTTVDDFSRMT